MKIIVFYPDVLDDMEQKEPSDKRDESDMVVVGVRDIGQLFASSDSADLNELMKCDQFQSDNP